MARSAISTPAIRGLLARAAAAFEADGIVPIDIEFGLAAEGYDLDRLDLDVQLIVANR